MKASTQRQRRRWCHTAIAVLAVATTATGQDEASTLAELVARAPAIAVAATDARALPHPYGMAIAFTTVATLAGNAPAAFTLVEPGERTCGRALYGLLPGRYVVFLDGALPARLAVGDARSIASASAELVEHVRALAATRTPEQRNRVLIAALDASDTRVQRDAALALPHAPVLEAISPLDRQHLVAALRKCLARGDDVATGRLAVAAARLRIDDALEPLVSAYLDGDVPSLEPLLRREILRLTADGAARIVAARLPLAPAGNERALALLEQTAAPAARPPLTSLMHSETLPLAARAGAALLTHHGVDAATLAAEAGAEVAAAAVARASDRAPRFRAVLRARRL